MTASWDGAVFDRLYARDPDPWGFESSAYERDKYDASLAALPAGRFMRGLEIGCSIGVFTRRLAERCDELVALDAAPAAVARARARCADLWRVTFVTGQVPAAWPAGRFDLIVLSEVLYFLDGADAARVAALAAAGLRAGGVALLVNWTGETDTPRTGDEAAEAFIAETGMTVITRRHAPGYRLDVLRR